MVAPPLPSIEKVQAVLAPFAPVDPTAPSNTTESPPDASIPEPLPLKLRLFPIKVPLQPPFNAQQAENWSNNHWPVIFNPAAPRSTVAPPLQVLNRSIESIKPYAGYYLSLARKVAEESSQSGRGRAVGAVVVDPEIAAEIDSASWGDPQHDPGQWIDAVVAVGGDARYARGEAGAPSQADLHPGMSPIPASETYNADLEGGPDLHALMRATELVARRRRECSMHEAETAAIAPLPVVASDPQLSMKLSPLEYHFLYPSDSPTPPSPGTNLSPKKRKHEEPNPEALATQLEINLDSPQPVPTTTSHPPLPAPPPSTNALADPAINPPNTELLESIPTSISNTTSQTTPHRASKIRTRAEGGYLCTDLDVYISHEPCLCCSMGMLLSRYRAVIFPRAGRMKTGGLASEPIVGPTPVSEDEVGQVNEEEDESSVRKIEDEDRLYYGLHWRKELNWHALGFEFVEDELGQDSRVGDGEALVFHA